MLDLRMSEPTKKCTKCGEDKPISEFYAERSSCKICWNASNKAYVKANPEIRDAIVKRYFESPRARQNRLEWQQTYRKQNRDQVRNAALLYRYGITLTQFQTILKTQNGKCKTCGTSNPGKKGWNTDHDHNCCLTGCVKCIRGLLCASCNMYLGRFEKNLHRLFSDVEYLSVGVIS
jgi:hypothetical protein